MRKTILLLISLMGFSAMGFAQDCKTTNCYMDTAPKTSKPAPAEKSNKSESGLSH